MKKNVITLESLVKQSPEPTVAELDGEVIMMSIETQQYYGLDPVGSRVWELCASQCKVGDLIETLMKEYNVDFDVCQKDIMELLTGLVEQQLIEVE